MGNDHIELGKTGESRALSFLRKNKFHIRETNYRSRFGEIDIIAKDIDILCFIEVKTRKGVEKGFPREAVTFTKQQKIIQAATAYLQQNQLMDSKIRFDVIEIIQTGNQFEIHQIQDAFQVP